MAASRSNFLLRSLVRGFRNRSRLPVIHQQRRMVNTQRFASLEFWEDYHKDHCRDRHHHEWFVDVDDAVGAVLPSLRAICDPDRRDRLLAKCTARDAMAAAPTILNLGCGTSTLGVKLASQPVAFAAGALVKNVDFSPACVDAMRLEYPDGGCHRNEWILADALHMPFDTGVFDLVVDKGTFDAFECADAGNRDDAKTTALCLEVDRVLKRDVCATWVQITHSAPELRLEVLLRALPRPSVESPSSVHQRWTVGYQSLGEDDTGFEYFVYTIRRRPQFALYVAAGTGVADGMGESPAALVESFVDADDANNAAAAAKSAGREYLVRKIDGSKL